ncbi:MAG: metal ABC transporter substrate-binding protein, partial [Candidatus Methylomirabilales bacterium]
MHRVTAFVQRTGLRLSIAILLGTLLLGLPAEGVAKKIRVMGSSSDMIAIAQEIAKDRMKGYSPFAGYQEPELYIEEVFPSWAMRAARADLYIQIGLFADVWANTLLIDSRNHRVFPGEVGHVDASRGIRVLEVPTWKIDRSRGEIHIQGNPHYLLDPLNGKIVADNILRGLIRVSPDDAEFFRTNADDFKARIDRAMERWQQQARALRGKKLAAYHKTWSYLAHRFGFEVAGYCEPKPGIEPSPRELRDLIETMKREKATLVIYAPVYSPRIPEFVAGQVGG